MHGGRRPGAGRKKGALTQKTQDIARDAIERGLITPLEVLLEAMRHYHEAGDRKSAAAIAKDAAPYVHPRLSAVQLSGGPTPVQLQVEEIVVISPGTPSTNGTNGHHPTGQAAPGAT